MTGLNQTEVAATLKVFRSIRRDFRSTILLVEHNMKAGMALCDRVVVLHTASSWPPARPPRYGRTKP